MVYQVVFTPGICLQVEAGTTVMEAALRAGMQIDAPCGGSGICGKCIVKVTNNGVTTQEHACKYKIYSNITVELQSAASGHRILLDGTPMEACFSISPVIKRVHVTVEKPVLSDRRSDWERVKDAVAKKTGLAPDSKANIPVISSLYRKLISNKYEVDVFICDRYILDVVASGSPLLGVAFDIGTTTIAAYLLNLETGVQMAVDSALNPQSKYGADVIMRSQHSIVNGAQDLSSSVRTALNKLIASTVNKTGFTSSDIYLVSVVGNTCMHHLFLGLSPESLVVAPYIPAVSEPLTVPPADVELEMNANGKVLLLPNIAGFVGADTVGAVLASEIYKAEKMTLLIDIGTNGEMVLGNNTRMLACSTAAGPAFEGALISCGMRGAKGAIDHFELADDGTPHYTVIGGGAPEGICGSGLIDIIAALLKQGIIDESGRLLEVSDRVVTVGGMRRYILVPDTVYLTQKDIREVQLAKGAVAAGIKMLCKTLHIQTTDIVEVLIAGAFGNYMSASSACAIALIPPELQERIIPIGNAAGQGAKLVALEESMLGTSRTLAENIGYLELAADPAFQDMYIDELEFIAN